MSRRAVVPTVLLLVVVAKATAALPPQDWSRPIPLSTDAAILSNGDAVFTGRFAGAVQIGDSSVTAAGAYDLHLARFDEAGNTLWVRTAGEAGGTETSNEAEGVAPDGVGGCFMVGEYRQTLVFDATHLLSSSSLAIFIARYDADGNVSWVGSYAPPDAPHVVGAAPDGAGGCYLSAYSFGDQDAHQWLLHYTAEGARDWELASTEGYATAIASDAGGNAVLAGGFTSAFDPDGPFMPGVFAIARVDPSGQVLGVGVPHGGIQSNSTAVAPDGAVYLCGSYFGLTELAEIVLQPHTLYSDGFLARIDPDGSLAWAREIAGARIDAEAEVLDLALRPGGDCVATGRDHLGVVVQGDSLLSSNGHQGGFVMEWSHDGTLLDLISSGSAPVESSSPRPIAADAHTVFRFTVDDPSPGGHVIGHRGVTAVATPVARSDGAWLLRSEPNPFNARTLVGFHLSEAGPVEVTIHDPAGRRICTLVKGWRPAGLHRMAWNGRDDRGGAVASGIYLVRLVAGAFTDSGKLVLVE